MNLVRGLACLKSPCTSRITYKKYLGMESVKQSIKQSKYFHRNEMTTGHVRLLLMAEIRIEIQKRRYENISLALRPYSMHMEIFAVRKWE